VVAPPGELAAREPLRSALSEGRSAGTALSDVAATVANTSDHPLELLHAVAGLDTTFRPGQREAIDAVVAERRRVLLVQRTGWGKSAVYFIATRLLRDSGAGPTILVSPLLALMRNQIQMAERAGVRARTINSENRDDWEAIRASVSRDEVDSRWTLTVVAAALLEAGSGPVSLFVLAKSARD
jgi:superfamily II DNA helicase RecQ